MCVRVSDDSINGSGCNLGCPMKSSILGHAEKWPVCSLNYMVSWPALPKPAHTAHTLLRPLAVMTAEPSYPFAGFTKQCWKSPLNAKTCESQSRHGVKTVWLRTLCPTSSREMGKTQKHLFPGIVYFHVTNCAAEWKQGPSVALVVKIRLLLLLF